jgi:sugar O-acyltransferase (sialic acid O-acetyltransferase NeuD family)
MEKKIFIIGSGGHSRVIIECAELLNFKIESIIDINQKNNTNEKIFNIKVKPKNYIKKIKKNSYIFLAIGDNFLRQRYYNKLFNFFKFINLIHPESYVSKYAKLGNGNYIGAKSVINPGVKIGTNCIINTSAVIEHETNISNNVHIGPGSIVCGRCKLNDNSFIGANSIIIENVTISKNNIIGAGSVVVKNTKNNSTYIGIPAKKK